MAAVPQHSEERYIYLYITVDSLIWSFTCAISATDPVESDQGLKLDSAPTASQKHLGVLVNRRKPKNQPLVWPSADIIWKNKMTLSGIKGNKMLKEVEK